ncbi:MAG: NAD-dependent epimerase/dehydratase family protein [Magnetococcales bacterium]|nr:NAD-dependent epimerase/dehydratase family protein [Magnetococcales bacterium]
MNVLVFGGSGFLGSYVADALLERGYAVTIYDIRPSPYLKGRGRMIVDTVMNAEKVSEAVAGHQVVYNFAGMADLNASIHQPLETINLNVMGNLHVLEACRRHGVKRLLFASSAYVFSKHGAFYGVSKKSSELIIEEYARQFDLNFTMLRYGSVYGQRADATNRIYRIIRQALTEDKITFEGDGSELREYIHGRDAATLSVDVLEDDAFINKHVILTGNERFRYKDLLYLIRETLDNTIELEFLNQNYHGHYVMTPYTFAPTVGVKLTNNPHVDFGQGILECIDRLYIEMEREGSSDLT